MRFPRWPSTVNCLGVQAEVWIFNEHLSHLSLCTPKINMVKMLSRAPTKCTQVSAGFLLDRRNRIFRIDGYAPVCMHLFVCKRPHLLPFTDVCAFLSFSQCPALFVCSSLPLSPSLSLSLFLSVSFSLFLVCSRHRCRYRS